MTLVATPLSFKKYHTRTPTGEFCRPHLPPQPCLRQIAEIPATGNGTVPAAHFGEGTAPTTTYLTNGAATAVPQNAPSAEEDNGRISLHTTALRDPPIPEFRGDTALTRARAWIARLELKLGAHSIPRASWPLAALRRFLLGSPAQLWAYARYGHGKDFATPTWADLTKALLADFGNPCEHLDAESAWVNLHQVWTSNPVQNVSIFIAALDQLNRARTEDKEAAEPAEAVAWGYELRLSGALSLHIKGLIAVRKRLHEMIATHGTRSKTPAISVTELLNATLDWARLTASTTTCAFQIGVTAKAVAQAAPVTNPPPPVASDYIPMDLDSIILALTQVQNTKKFPKSRNSGNHNGSQ
ncbi:MAG: hypothetical protein JWP29_5505, partial [Rhodoferax sp.]|nr:hypothetical protein [Rhodoferax sp.]